MSDLTFNDGFEEYPVEKVADVADINAAVAAGDADTLGWFTDYGLPVLGTTNTTANLTTGLELENQGKSPLLKVGQSSVAPNRTLQVESTPSPSKSDDAAFITAGHTKACWNEHVAAWAILPSYFKAKFDMFKAGMDLRVPPADAQFGEDEDEPEKVGSTAIISIAGPMMKFASKFGGASTLAIRKQLRAALQDEDVSAILLHIDSPGGTVAGTHELASAVAAANKIKPVTAFIDDLGASAAYWVASQAGTIVVNRMGLVGSIGVITTVVDSSVAAEREGLKVHIIATGDMKGAGTPGTEVTDEHLAELQSLVDNINKVFLSEVAKNRPMTAEELLGLQANVFAAPEALKLGLVDKVDTLDNTLAELNKLQSGKQSARLNSTARQRLALAKAKARNLGAEFPDSEK